MALALLHREYPSSSLFNIEHIAPFSSKDIVVSGLRRKGTSLVIYGCGIIYLRVWLLLVVDGVSGRGRLPEERHVVRRRRLETVAHVLLVCGAAPNGALWLAAAVALLSDPEQGQQWSQEG